MKIGGERAYKRARRGESFEMPERIVTVYSLRAALARARATDGPRAAFEIECGSGTYVRSLIADLGDAYCLELRRTAIGPFDVGDAIAPPARGASWPPRRAARRRCWAALEPARARSWCSRAPSGRRTIARRRAELGFGAVKVTRLPDVGPAAERSASPSAPSTACTWATAR